MSGMVDIKTGQIIGTEEGTLSYYHELSHLEYSKNPLGMRATFYMESFIVLSLAALVVNVWSDLTFFKILPTVTVGLFYTLYFFEEAWCWKNAYKLKAKAESTTSDSLKLD